MERATLGQELARAGQHVTEGELHIKRQREIIEELEHDGHARAASSAVELLRVLEQTQSLHVADCDRFRRELAGKH